MANRQMSALCFATLLLAPVAEAKNVVFFLGDGMGISTLRQLEFLLAKREVRTVRNLI